MKNTFNPARINFKNKRREIRARANPDRVAFGESIHRLLTTPSTFDNSAVWAEQRKIAEEIAPLIRRNQSQG